MNLIFCNKQDINIENTSITKRYAQKIMLEIDTLKKNHLRFRTKLKLEKMYLDSSKVYLNFENFSIRYTEKS